MQQPDLGKQIASLRKAKGFTQEELVGKCNINVRTLQRIETGSIMPRSYTLRAIYQALDYTPEVYSQKKVVFFSLSLKSVKELFNLKTNKMQKLSILSGSILIIVLAFSVTITQSHAKKFNKKDYVSSNSRNIIFLLPKGVPISISNMKDTADHKVGKNLIQEYKGAIYLNGEYKFNVTPGDTVILKKGDLFHKPSLSHLHWSHAPFSSMYGKGIIYIFPKQGFGHSQHYKDYEIYDIAGHHVKEQNNKIYLDDKYQGDAFPNDTVILEYSRITIQKHVVPE